MKRKNAAGSVRGAEGNEGGEHPNRTMRLLLERASCRNFTDRKIPPRVLERILEAGIHSPTGGNLQPYSIVKVEEKSTKRRLTELCGGQTWIDRASVDLLFCIDWYRIERWARLEVAPFTATSSFRHFWISFQDTIICAQNICIAADSCGLGSVYIGTVLECFRELQEMFQLPKGVLPVVLLCLGYPKTVPKPRRKLGPEVIVHNEKYCEVADQHLKDAFNEKYLDLRTDITDERIEVISDVCTKVHGEDFARSCAERIRENGYINAVQHYFGLHYRADLMPENNDDFMELVEDFGFSWFKRYHPRREQ